ncbi:MAG: tetratricopeptide repeat protein [Betaproteobacteria bacterium]|nr:tetratricopeptide repeat protein [Betaproteobacteria bacterium]
MIDVDNPTAPADAEALIIALSRCRTLHEHGRYAEALPLARACLMQAKTLGDHRLQFRALTALGHVLRASGDFTAALDTLTEALTLADDADSRAKAWNNIGLLFLSGSAWALAIECFYKITTQRVLARTTDAYQAHINIALCYLYLDDVKNGLPEARQALKREPPNLADDEPHNYVLLRYTFVQLALKGNRIRRAEIQRRADEAAACAARHPNPRIDIWAALIKGSLQAAYGPREAGILQLEAALAQTQAVPELTTDALGCLVEAEKLAGRPARALHYLKQWIAHLYQDAGMQATQKLGICDIWRIGENLYEQWHELGGEALPAPQPPSTPPPLPPAFRQNLIDWIQQTW